MQSSHQVEPFSLKKPSTISAYANVIIHKKIALKFKAIFYLRFIEKSVSPRSILPPDDFKSRYKVLLVVGLKISLRKLKRCVVE
jgi:hypothetical protein